MAELVFQRQQQAEQAQGVRQRRAALRDNRGNAPTNNLPDSRTAQKLEKPNETGLPNNLKHGVESLSGMSVDKDKVHNNQHRSFQFARASSVQDSRLFNLGASVTQLTAVHNLTHTSHLKSKGKSWKKHHQYHAKVGWHKCSVKRCRRMATVGAHVRETGAPKNTTARFIVPFCQYHNKRHENTALPLKPGTKLVGVGKGRVKTSD